MSAAAGFQDAAPSEATAPLTLADLRPGEEAVIVALNGRPRSRLRLMELGFLPGGRVSLIRRAPFGCPLEIECDRVRLGVRVETARDVYVARDPARAARTT